VAETTTVVVTFRIDPSEVGLDLPEGAVPVGVLLTENAAGEIESIEAAAVSREGGDVVAQMTMTHFSPAIFVFSDNVAFLLTPAEIELSVGESRMVELVKRDLGTHEDLPRDPGVFGEWGEVTQHWDTAPFTVKLMVSGPESFGSVTVSCTAPTDGWVADAYGVSIWKDRSDKTVDTHRRLVLLNVFGDLDLFGAADEVAAIKLGVRGRCTAAEEATGGGSTDGGGSSVEVNGANADGQASGDIVGVVGGCKDGGSKHVDCVPFIDITGVRWGPVDGSPNLVEIAVTLGGPPPEGASADHVATVTGSEPGSRVQEQIRVLRGEFNCESFRGGEPGEACESPAPDQFVIRVDVSELTYPLKLELFTLHNVTGGRVGDHYVIENIGE
jgi:hypothetical protein